MGVFTRNLGIPRDTVYDLRITIHEYGHGAYSRLHCGPNVVLLPSNTFFGGKSCVARFLVSLRAVIGDEGRLWYASCEFRGLNHEERHASDVSLSAQALQSPF